MNTQRSRKRNSPIPFKPVFHIPTCIHRHTAMHISQPHVLTQILTLWSKQMLTLKYKRKRPALLLCETTGCWLQSSESVSKVTWSKRDLLFCISILKNKIFSFLFFFPRRNISKCSTSDSVNTSLWWKIAAKNIPTISKPTDFFFQSWKKKPQPTNNTFLILWFLVLFV